MLHVLSELHCRFCLNWIPFFLHPPGTQILSLSLYLIFEKEKKTRRKELRTTCEYWKMAQNGFTNIELYMNKIVYSNKSKWKWFIFSFLFLHSALFDEQFRANSVKCAHTLFVFNARSSVCRKVWTGMEKKKSHQHYIDVAHKTMRNEHFQIVYMCVFSANSLIFDDAERNFSEFFFPFIMLR